MARAEEVGDCLEWQKYFQNGTPYVQHGDRFMSARALMMELLGNRYEGRMFYGTTCGNKACIKPEHIAVRPMKSHATHMAKQVDSNGLVRLAKLRKAAESRRLLDDDQVMQVLMDPRSCAEIALDFNCSKSLVSRIKRGKSSRMAIAKNNPFWGLMA